VCDDPAVAGKPRDVVAEEISTGHHPLFDHLRGVLARDLRASIADLEDLELATKPAPTRRYSQRGIMWVIGEGSLGSRRWHAGSDRSWKKAYLPRGSSWLRHFS
jgi:hypothetical protein